MDELGHKRHCRDCGKNFYDLNKPDPECPVCSSKNNYIVIGKQYKANDKLPVNYVKNSRIIGRT